MKFFLSPNDLARELLPDADKISRLQAGYLQGKRFLLVAEADQREMVGWILASFHSPLAVVPLAPGLPPPELNRILAELPVEECVWAHELPANGSALPPKKSLDSIWAVIFSSGSTGLPKGVALSGSALKAAAHAHGEHLGLHSWLLNLPLHHVGGFSVISRAFFLGTFIALAGSKFDIGQTQAWLSSGLISGISLVPTTLNRLVKMGITGKGLAIALVGGAPTSPALVERALELQWPIRLTYGCTENASQAATQKLADGGMVPLPGVDIEIDRDGEILLRSAALADGIFRSGKVAPLPLRNGFYATGDLGQLTSRGLLVGGRKSDLIITGGVKVFPAEIEKLLEHFPGMGEFAVVGIPSQEWGEAVCLMLTGDASPETVISFLREKIDPKKLPKRIFKVPLIPRTSTGKVRRAELSQLAKSLNGADSKYN